MMHVMLCVPCELYENEIYPNLVFHLCNEIIKCVQCTGIHLCLFLKNNANN